MQLWLIDTTALYKYVLYSKAKAMPTDCHIRLSHPKTQDMSKENFRDNSREAREVFLCISSFNTIIVEVVALC